MAHIVPALGFLQQLKRGIEQGRSVHDSFTSIFETDEGPFVNKMALWFAYYKNSVENKVVFKTQLQKSLVEILSHGLAGAPIYEHLLILEQEMTEEFERQWKVYLEGLPAKLSLPLLLFFFPAYIILLFGPLVIQFLQEVQ